MADLIEPIAKIVYEAMRFERGGDTPAWVEGGNSLAQVEARRAAHAIAALPAQGLRVKPLVWERSTEPGEFLVAFCPVGEERYVADDLEDAARRDAARSARILAALAPAEAGGVEALHAAGRDMLALHDGFLSGADVDIPAANRLHLAASFGAQAFAVCPIPDARPAAMIRAIALALIEPMHSDLDYLRRVNMARPVEAPMMTDLMVDPESIDDFLAANPLPPTHVDDSEQPETAITPAPVDALVKAAEAIADDACSYICPSTGKAGEPIPHDPRCVAFRAAIADAKGGRDA